MEQIVIRPIITEKSLALAGKGLYTFAVNPKKNKPQIADAVNNLYKVTVTGVSTISMHGKTRRSGRKMTLVTKPNWKKAIVTLVKGQKIDAFEVTKQEEEKKPEVKK